MGLADAGAGSADFTGVVLWVYVELDWTARDLLLGVFYVNCVDAGVSGGIGGTEDLLTCLIDLNLYGTIVGPKQSYL